ncbi:MAG: tetratricopeptide repeat protein [Terracidiphilus sp.]
MRKSIVLLGLSLTLALLVPGLARAQAAGENDPVMGSVGDRGRILLVLPFDNRSGQPSLEWIREAAAEILSSRLAAAGFAPMSRADRMYALDHLGFPEGFHPSRATSIKLAETLDADAIIVGSFITDGGAIVAQAQVVDVPHLRMSQPVTARGPMNSMIPVFGRLAWKLARQLDPGFSGSQQTFVSAGSNLRLDAFEQYIRGITEPDQAERLRHLNLAVQLSPEYAKAWMALGREEYADQQYEQAAQAFSRVSSSGSERSDALEAGFYDGLSLLFSGDYAGAEKAFAGVARVLPLAEVLNDQGVALARQGKDGVPFFRRAVAADPSDSDYHFNLAVSLKRRGNAAEAMAELAQCLRLNPNDNEARTVQRAWSEAGEATGSSAGDASGESQDSAEVAVDPLERIKRSFDVAGFRQAFSMLNQVETARLAVLPPSERAQRLSLQARGYLDHGLLLEAERSYQAALAADSGCAEAHAGMAEIDERTGDLAAARKEATLSLERMPSIDAYLVLGRVNLATGRLDQAGQNADAALKIDPASKPALALRQRIAAMSKEKK